MGTSDKTEYLSLNNKTEYLYLGNNIGRYGGSLAYIEVSVIGGSEKAMKFGLPNGEFFWMPKAVVKRPKSGVFKGDLTVAHWWNGFDERTYNKVKEFIRVVTT